MKSAQGLFTNSLFFLGAALMAVSLPGWSTSSAHPDLKPIWRNVSPEDWNPNVSFLGRTEVSASSFDLGDWIDPSKIRELREAYEANRRSYELQEEYHLSWQPYEQSYNAWASGMSNQIINEMRDHKLRQEQAKLEEKIGVEDEKRKLERTYGERARRSTVARTAFGLAVLSTGSELKTDLGKDFLLYTSTNLPWKVAYAKLSSPFVETTFTFVPDGYNGGPHFIPGPPDWLRTQERYTLGMARALPFWSLSAGVTYLGTSDLMTSTLTKPLFPDFVASYEATLPMTPGKPGAPLPENTLKVKYEKHF